MIEFLDTHGFGEQADEPRIADEPRAVVEEFLMGSILTYGW